MPETELRVDGYVRLEKPNLQLVIDALHDSDYRVVGPRFADEAIVYGDLDSIDQLPIGIRDNQDAGRYRIEPQLSEYWFDFVVGPQSLKDFLFPPRESLLKLDRCNGEWTINDEQPECEPLAVIGPRSCDLEAMKVQDRVFISDTFVDPGYKSRREQTFIVAVNCRRAAVTCFCHSMNTGPECQDGFDLVLTELADCFVVRIGSSQGLDVIRRVDWSHCSAAELQESDAVSSDLTDLLQSRSEQNGESKGRWLDTEGVHDLLLNNLDHPRWAEIGQRCLACANCTMVCPTCFCSHVEEVSDLTANHVTRERSWASCFTSEHSAMSSGSVRGSIASRYRQWLTHKLATWTDQFDTSGCVGCGRCITWCPVGIDLTEEVDAIRKSTQ